MAAECAGGPGEFAEPGEGEGERNQQQVAQCPLFDRLVTLTSGMLQQCFTVVRFVVLN